MMNNLTKTCVLAFLFGHFALQSQARNTVNDKDFGFRRFINKDIVKEIKDYNASWTPYEADKNPFVGRSEAEIRSLFGLKLAEDMNPIKSRLSKGRTGRHHHQTEAQFNNEKKRVSQALPDSFDSRTEWPDCIHDVRDQGWCGSCWAFSTAGFLEDRFCIASGGAINVRLSPQDMITCDYQNGGCNGGFLTPALNYAVSRGLVSDECMPYQLSTGYCTYQCADSSIRYKKYHCKPGSLKMLTDADEIKAEIMTNGPMNVGFTVYTDFMNYESGVYEYVTGWVEGGHAVKLIGWDHLNGRLYWILQNQWGADWGESGYFNVYANEVGLDSTAFACDPDLDWAL